MNYGLAKQLKEAGFPQSIYDRRYAGLKEKDTYVDGIYFPTLSELIEACGSRFCRFELQYWPNKHLTMEEWWATARDLNDENYDMGGSTPEEAVAELWLELNKK